MRIPRYKTAGVVLFAGLALVVWLAYAQFQGKFTPKAQLTMLSSRAGLVMDPGSKVTYNGVQIGRVAGISEVQEHDESVAKFTLDVDPQYLELIPANVNADIKGTTVFGGKVVSLTAPDNPVPQRVTPHQVIDARSVTTEMNTLFQTLTEIAQKVDPVKLNLTLSAAAEALTALGDKFGQSIINANIILDEVNPRMPQLRRDIQQLAALGDVYTKASPDLFDFLSNSVTTARTVHQQEAELDAALLAAVGLGNTGADVLGRSGPYLQRGAANLVPSSQLLDTYSPELFCTIRNYAEVGPKVYDILGGQDGYALDTITEVVGPGNPYIYPDNLPRVNARGGPGGAPGCWQPISHDFWPAPYLVMDSGASIAPYNHFEVGSPWAAEYVWGRQVGENTINP